MALIIKKEVLLELQRIHIGEIGGKDGNWAQYQFAMVSPSAHYFFKNPCTVSDEDFSMVWGQSPTITFLSKNFKDWRKAVIEKKIKPDIPEPFKLSDVRYWHLAIANYDTPRDKRPWAVYYSAETFYDENRVKRQCDRHVMVDKDFMDSILFTLPWELRMVEGSRAVD